MKTYQYLLFDADNTLFDFTRAEYLSFRDMCSVCNVDKNIGWSEELYRQYSAINDRLWKLFEKGEITLDSLKIERFRQLLTENGAPDNPTTYENSLKMRDIYMENLANQTCLVDGAEEICKKLAEKYPMYLITNGISRIQRSRFAKSALKPYFQDLFISEEIGIAKPHPEYFDHVLRKIGCADKRKYLVIGDSLSSDCAGAVNYGMDICYFTPHHRLTTDIDLTYTIHSLSELEPILLASEPLD